MDTWSAPKYNSSIPSTKFGSLCLVPKLATVFILKIFKSYLRIFLIHLAHCFFTAVTLGTPGSHALLAWALLKQRRRFHTRTNATLGLSASSVKSRHTDVKFTSRLQAIQKMHLLTHTPNPDVLSESGREGGRLATNFLWKSHLYPPLSRIRGRRYIHQDCSQVFLKESLFHKKPRRLHEGN